MLAGHLGELREHFIKEKAQPDAFPFAVFAHQVHAVIPVAGAHERQAVLTKSEGPKDGSHTVVIQTGRFLRPIGQIVIRVLLGVYRAALDEVDRLIQHAGVPGVQDVAARRQRQPEVIIGAMGPYAPAQGGVPPMLDISFRELAGGAQEQVLAHQVRLGVDQRHHVLQLIAETEGAPRLVEAAARPKAARR